MIRKLCGVLLIAGMLMFALGGVTYSAAAAAASVPIDGLVTNLAGQPIAAATVQIISISGNSRGEGSTGADGRFRVTAKLTERELYRIQVWAGGFRLGQSSWRLGSDRRPNTVQLTPFGGRVQGQVTIAGLPAGGATVQLRDAGGRVAMAVTANDRGRYELNAPPGEWQLAGAVGSLALAPATLFATDGSTQVVNLQTTRFSADIRGQVIDSQSGKALANTPIEVHRAGYGVVAAATAVNPDGRFTISVPAASEAEYMLKAWPAGYEPVESAPFSAKPGTEIDFTAGKSLFAIPAAANITGVLAEPDGQLLQGTAVWIEQKTVGILQETRTDERGRFRFDNLPAGAGRQYRVRTAPNLHMVTNSPWFSLAAGEVKALPLIVGQLTAVGTAPYKGLVVGRVLDHLGNPVAMADVVFIREGYGAAEETITDMDGIFRVRLWATRSDDVPSNAPGYRIRVSKSGYFATENVNGLEDGVLQFGSFDTVNLTVPIYPMTGPIYGRVVDADGRPIAKAAVKVLGAGGKQVAATETGADGRYRFPYIPTAAYPAYQIYVTAAGYYPANPFPPQDAPERGLQPDIALHSTTGTLAGRITDLDGQPALGVQVQAAGPNSLTAAAVTDQDGRWQLPNLPAGSALTLTLGGSGFFPVAPAPIALAPGGRQEINTGLFPAVTCLSGQVLSSAGINTAGSEIQLFREGAGRVGSTRADAGGFFKFTQLPTLGGWYYLQANLPDHQPIIFPGLFPLLPQTAGGCARHDVLLMPAL